MRLRSSRWAASVLALGMSSAIAIAQPPAAPGTDAAYPSEALNYSFDEGGNFYDELDLGSQFRFQADWLYFKRDNSVKDVPIIGGPESFRLKDTANDYASGYRLNLGFMNEDFELEGVFSEIKGIGGSLSGTLARKLVFDGEAAAGNAFLGGAENFLSTGTYFRPLNVAANIASPPSIVDETNEFEFLSEGAAFQANYKTDLQDFEVNLKGRRQTGRMLRFGFGFRNVRLNEIGSAGIRGTFDTLDTDGDTLPFPGDEDLNNELSHIALTGAGLIPAGADGFQGFSSGAGAGAEQDIVMFLSNTTATNQLNGLQATVDATFLESEYFTLGGYAKAGVYHNHARASIAETYFDLSDGGSYSQSLSSSKNRASFVGNLGVTGTLFLRDNLRLFTAYEVLFVSGVALAPDQHQGIGSDLAGNAVLNIQSNGSTMLHGGRVGIEILFP